MLATAGAPNAVSPPVCGTDRNAPAKEKHALPEIADARLCEANYPENNQREEAQDTE